MTNKPGFWVAQIVVLSLFYVAAIVLALNGESSHWVVRVSLILLVAHLLEIPLALRALRSKTVALPRLLLLTLLYGLLWWVPASRGLFGPR